MTVYGKNNAMRSIDRFYSSGRFPHALLFFGEKGIGKRTLADYTAMLCLCEKHGEKPCLSCKECKRIESHIHPDVVYPLSLMEDGKYKIEPLREFIVSCSRKPNDGDLRICIFEELDEMSVICQNSLLTFIEEPLPFNRFIFTAKKKAPVLTTILSRVTAIECDAANEREFNAALSESGVPSDRASELFALYGGNIGAALLAYNEPEQNEINEKAARIADSIISGSELDCAALFSSLKTREEIFAVLGVLTDIFAFAAARKAGLKNSGAFLPQTEKLVSKMKMKTLRSIYGECSRLYSKSGLNPNASLLASECSAMLFEAMEKTL